MWHETTADEIKAFISIEIAIGLSVTADRADHWSQYWLVGEMQHAKELKGVGLNWTPLQPTDYWDMFVCYDLPTNWEEIGADIGGLAPMAPTMLLPILKNLNNVFNQHLINSL